MKNTNMDEIIDKDSLRYKEVCNSFTCSFNLQCEKAISLDENYIVKINGTRSNKLAISVTNSPGEVYSCDGVDFEKVFSLPQSKTKSTDIKFSPLNDDLLYSSSLDGTIKLWDLRSGNNKPVNIFQENEEKKTSTKPITSFDISCDDRILCGGTDLIENDAFMLFWDLRGKDLLGAYWNSHTDDIIQVQFNKDRYDHLATASADGLINIFDISESCEDDALQYSLNADCAVDKLSWVSEKIVGCITQNVELQFWDVETADAIVKFDRKNITDSIMRTNPDDCYLVDIFRTKQGDPLIVAGSYSNNGQCLRALQLTDKKLSMSANFGKNKQVTRCGWFNMEDENLYTGGEAGILSLWKPGDTKTILSKHLNKITPGVEKLKIHKKKPYQKK